MKCAKCGAELKPGARFCGKCGEIIKESTEPRKPLPSGGGKIGSFLDSNKMPQGIALGVNERVVKQYSIGQYTFRQGSIDVIITNKRVIRYEDSTWLGMRNNQIDEINIDAVHGNYTRMRRSISILGLISSIVLAVLGYILLTETLTGYYRSPLESPAGCILILLAFIILAFSFKPTFEFGLLGSIGNTALGTYVNGRGRFFRNDSNSIIFQFKPTPESTVMLKEIGACIFDLKTLGDKAIDKWSNSGSASGW